MYELFKTVLILSGLGVGLIAILLILKPVALKKFPAKWQYWVWIVVMLSMLVPAYRFIPKEEVQKLADVQKTDIIKPEATNDRVYVTIPGGELRDFAKDESLKLLPRLRVRLWDLAAYVWFLGVCIYLLAVGLSYGVYLAKKRKSSVIAADTALLDKVKSELKIKRKIRLKVCKNIQSPMLVGIILPTIYIPQTEICDENMRMIFLHELTHYKRRDLFIKWLAAFVNAVHWFNPFAYIMCANVSEACEIACDMTVTENMSEDEQKIYMKTILDLAN